jgi:hypothetical protein
MLTRLYNLANKARAETPSPAPAETPSPAPATPEEELERILREATKVSVRNSNPSIAEEDSLRNQTALMILMAQNGDLFTKYEKDYAVKLYFDKYNLPYDRRFNTVTFKDNNAKYAFVESQLDRFKRLIIRATTEEYKNEGLVSFLETVIDEYMQYLINIDQRYKKKEDGEYEHDEKLSLIFTEKFHNARIVNDLITDAGLIFAGYQVPPPTKYAGYPDSSPTEYPRTLAKVTQKRLRRRGGRRRSNTNKRRMTRRRRFTKNKRQIRIIKYTRNKYPPK